MTLCESSSWSVMIIIMFLSSLKLYTKSSKESQFSSLYCNYIRTCIYFVYCLRHILG
jgi:hypothetical protein